MRALLKELLIVGVVAIAILALFLTFRALSVIANLPTK